MADRVVKVVLSAQVQQYIAGMDRARKATAETGTEAEKLGRKKQDFDLLGRSGLAMGVALGAGLAIVASKAADFNQAMSYVDAATHETADNMSLLRQAALDAGASTVFSATESANAIEELGKAGLSTKDILTGGLGGSLNLAAAGGLGVAEAAGYAATALQQFGLRGADTSHVADLLAAGAGKAMGDVSDLSQALNQAGLVANSAGLSIEETTGGLSAFASAGLLGSDAGTSFKSMLQRLTPQSAEAKELMEELGISAYDAGGNFIGLANFAGVLQQALKDKTVEERNSAQATIFGSDAVRASNVLYEEGAKGIQGWIDKVDDQGYAADTAARRLDNLKGDIEALGGAFDTALITSGSQANEVLRFIVQTATDGVDAFNSLPGPVQGATLAVGALAAAVGVAAAAFFLGAPKVAEYRAAIDDLGPGAQRASRTVGAVAKAAGAFGAAATIATVAGGFLFDQLESIKATGDEVENTLRTASSAQQVLTEASKGMEVTWWTDIATDSKSVKDALQSAANSSVNFFDAMSQTQAQKGIIDTFQRVGKGLGQLASTDLPGAQSAFARLSDELKLNERQQWQALSNMSDYKAALLEQANTLGIDADKANLLALANGEIGATSVEAQTGLESVAVAAGVTTEQIQALVDGIRNYGSATSELLTANSDLYQSIDDARAAWGEEGFAATLDLTSQAGRDNTAVLLGLAEAANNAAAETYENTGSQDELVAKLGEGRQALYDQARQFFETDDAAQQYVDSLMETPEQVTTQVTLNGAAEAQTALDRITADRTVAVNVLVNEAMTNGNYSSTGIQPYMTDDNARGGTIGFAGGGTVFGAGTSKSDSIYARLSKGEEVIQQPYASMFRSELKQMNVGVRPSSSGGVTNNWTVVAPSGTSAEVAGRSAMAYASRKQRRSFA